jgi:hypothetical protein
MRCFFGTLVRKNLLIVRASISKESKDSELNDKGKYFTDTSEGETQIDEISPISFFSKEEFGVRTEGIKELKIGSMRRFRRNFREK